MVQSRLFLQFKELQHFFFDKKDSVKSKKYQRLIDNSMSVEQVHGNKVVSDLTRYLHHKYFTGADGIVTDRPFFLRIKTADCLPILFYEYKKKIIGAIHAGRRGLLAGIINEAFLKIEKMGGERKNIISAVGPHIRVCCYDVSGEQVLKFKNNIGNKIQIAEYRNFKWYLDLERIAFLQMESLGILKKNIDILPICTFCDRRFFSYRRDGRSCGRMYNIIGLKKGD